MLMDLIMRLLNNTMMFPSPTLASPLHQPPVTYLYPSLASSQKFMGRRRGATTMECFEWLLADADKHTIFVYGYLKLPTVVRAFCDEVDSMPIARRMQPARAIGYRLYEQVVNGDPFMVFTGNERDVVHGMLVFAVEHEAAVAMYRSERIGMGQFEIVVEAEFIEEGPGLRDRWVGVTQALTVETFLWTDSLETMRWKGLPVWAVDMFLRRPSYDTFRRPGELESEETIPLEYRFSDYQHCGRRYFSGECRDHFHFSIDRIPGEQDYAYQTRDAMLVLLEDASFEDQSLDTLYAQALTWI
ncbi:uncharacterized protein BP01DRAFT_382627 [Aspergillus saccharolyticus JOP 1030-1]|uniref:Gamma-glutamylcyclotransferase AIG2-like domain-containing protein n=1 Tax=Aspergillus saccharolyticus JOP 1030-1 TaxID=1450539 RepID=A0A318ZZW6_9EURO|nr:hypothetical protein BP01DRAFT_382627 [Aspergillus saccharolyticus JOP 1030-1]PYH45608.1 hypothetical protein BP01DRAFT_382627 [Aspergillus saccharolyticus JOP 1030-1]